MDHALASDLEDNVYNMYMSQLNLHVKPDFDRDLASLMRLRGIATKSEAIRIAVREAAERAQRSTRTDFSGWKGAALDAALNPKPRFSSDDELWGDNGR